MKLPENTVLRWIVVGAIVGAVTSVLFVTGITDPKPYPWEGEGLIANVARIFGQIIGGAFFLGIIGLIAAGIRKLGRRP